MNVALKQVDVICTGIFYSNSNIESICKFPDAESSEFFTAVTICTEKMAAPGIVVSACLWIACQKLQLLF